MAKTGMDDIIGIEIDCIIKAGKALVAKDGGGIFGKAKTSDPYVQVSFMGRVLGKTSTIKKSLDVRHPFSNQRHPASHYCLSLTQTRSHPPPQPSWNETFKWVLQGRGFKADAELVFAIFDYDKASANDPMGEVRIPMASLVSGLVREKWYPVQKCKGCKNATGELQLNMCGALRRAISLKKKETMVVDCSTIAVGLGWDPLPGNGAIDLDASCVCVSFSGDILENECVYFAQLASQNGAIRHTGDEREGDEDLGQGDDEIIIVDLARVPAHVCALYFLATVASEGRSFADVKSSRIRLVDWSTGGEKCRFMPAMSGAHTGLFLARVARPSPRAPWMLSAMGDFDHTARDWGTLVPEIKMFSRDLVPEVKVDTNERVAIMRKGGVIRVRDYCGGGAATAAIPRLVMGLAWDVTDGVDIDLDASVIMLDAHLRQLDLVFFGKLKSSDNSIVHHGDQRTGSAKGDDESVTLDLARIHPDVRYIGFVVNSYSGQELDDVKNAACHLYDAATYRDIAVFKMTNTAFLDKHTALVVGMLYACEDSTSRRYACSL